MKHKQASPWAILAVTSLAVFAVMLDALLTDDVDDVYPGEQASQIAAWLLQDPKAVERLFAQSVEA